MTRQDVLAEMQRILKGHTAALASVFLTQTEFQLGIIEAHQAFADHDTSLQVVIEANQAALQLLDRIIKEGVEHDD